MYSRMADGRTSRYFRYRFMDRDRRCVFRFDTHGGPILDGEPCHVHIGESETAIEEGHALASGLALRKMDFLTAFHLAVLHLKGKPLPWE